MCVQRLSSYARLHSTLSSEADSLELERQLAPRERAWLRWLRRVGWALIGLYFIVALSLLAARYWALPKLPDYRDQFAQMASDALGQRVTIDALTADWHGFHPWIELRGVTVHDRDDRPALQLPSVRGVIAWRSLLARELRLRTLVIDRADLDIRRAADGRLYVAGMELGPGPQSATSPADWILRQGEIHVRDGSIEWRDEQRNAPPLRLRELNVLIRNSGNTHNFALRAAPPAEYGHALDVRGQVSGRTFVQLRDWNGRLYAGIDALDLSVWRQWVDYPVDLHGGRGALRLWLTLTQRQVAEARAQVAFADVALRMAPQLPELHLAVLQGEVGAKQTQSTLALLGLGNARPAYEAYGRNLVMRSAAGEALRPADFTARWQPGEADEAAQGTFTVKAVELKPLARLSEHFLLPERFRALIKTLSPQGVLHDVRFNWSGALEAPLQYAAKARFAQLGIAPYGDIPGFDHLNGEFDINEKSGRVKAEGRKVGIHYPGVFVEAQHELDKLAGRVNWTVRDHDLDVRIEDLLFENADASGSVSGSVRATAAGANIVDLTARASRARGVAVYKYIPHLPTEVAHWLQRGILQGSASDVRFRLRGDLDDFPYRDPKKGEFKVSAKLAGVQLRYDDEWPSIEGITGDIAFDGPALVIKAQRATSLGAQLNDVQARFADVYKDHAVLRVEGKARGPSNEFLKFIARSPVRGFIGGLTDGWSAAGPGELDLALDLPLHALDEAKVAGHYQFDGNSIVMAAGDPPMTQVKGRIDFTEQGASSPGISAQYLNGPLNVRVENQQGAVVVTATGSADAAGLMRTASLPRTDRVKGVARYRATFKMRDRQTSAVFESNLQGVSVDLPPPFAKRATENWPLRIERVSESDTRLRLSATLAALLNVQGSLRKDGNRMVLDRAGVAIGDVPVPKPEGAFIAVAVNVPSLSVDTFAPFGGDTGAGRSSMPPLGALSLRTDRLTGAGRVVHDVSLRAQLRGQVWRADVTARELAGEVSWLPKGNGVIKARLSHLHHPEMVENAAIQSSDNFKDLPALDIVADRYVLDGRELGRLELQAFNEKGGWRIDHAALSTASGTASASGLWVPARTGAERTELDISVKAQDIGAYLAQVGYGDAVRGGKGELTGRVSWNGPPTDLDYGSLSGALQMRAEDGQFVKLKPGVGRLLGVLSLQSLPRRITLDFKDVFGEGFAFDRIDGTAKIARGVMTTGDLGMVGTSATVVITGAADLAKETQNLHVRVVPTVGDSVAAAAGLALLNPVVGVGAWIAQRLLKDPLGRMLAYEYAVTGSWDDPQVEKLSEPRADRAPATQAGKENEAQ